MIRTLDGAELVARCQAIADRSGRGVRRRGALVAAVVLGETSSIAKARKMLDDIPGHVVAPDVRTAAHGLISQVLTEALEGASPQQFDDERNDR